MSNKPFTSIFSPEEYAELERVSELLNTPLEEIVRDAVEQLLRQRKLTDLPDAKQSDALQVIKLEGLMYSPSSLSGESYR